MSSLCADHPSHRRLIDLGPGNEDTTKILNDEIKVKRSRQWDPSTNKFDPSINMGITQKIDLSGRDLRGAVIHLELEAIHDAVFDGANFTNADLSETCFKNCSFRGAILRNVELDLDDDCDLTDADITGSRIYLKANQLISTKNYKEKDLSNAILEGDLSGVSFDGFDLRGALFYCRNLEGCDFSNARIEGAFFSIGFEPSSRSAIGKYPSKIALTKEQLYSTKSYQEKNLDRVVFSGCDLQDFDFSEQCLGRFVACDLDEADFSNAYFPTPESGIWLNPLQERFRYGFSDCYMSADQFHSTRNFKLKQLPLNFYLENMNLNQWDFSNFNLRHISFRGSEVRGASYYNVRGGLFEFSKGFQQSQARTTWHFRNSQLKEFGFSLPAGMEDALQKELSKVSSGEPKE
jgi:uncharacterized protein YjbI with pentapeptide repeats